MFLEKSEVELCDIVRADRGESERARAAFAELYSRSYGLAMATAYRLIGDRFQAEDAVSEAYAKTLRALQRGLGPSDSFSAYLMTAVRSEAFRTSSIDNATVSVESDVLEDLSQTVEPDSAVGLAERDQLIRAFKSLPESWRRVLYLVDVAEETREGAAETMGVTLRATNSLLFRAREALRESYLQQHAERANPRCSGVVTLRDALCAGGYVRRRGQWLQSM